MGDKRKELAEQLTAEIQSVENIGMQNLTVIENDLVPVYETSTGEKVVYGSELHEVLGVKSNYRDWIKNRLNDCEAVENEDYEAAKILAPSGQSRKEHIIKLDTAKEMAMLERNDKGKQVRRYFIQIEKKYKNAKINLEGLSKELQAVIVVDKRVTKVEQRIDKIEDTMVIDYGQQQVLKRKVNAVVVRWLGGKESNAYKEISKKVFSECNKDFQNYFNVNSRNNTPRCKFEEAITYVEQWEPCNNTKLKIKDYNAQMSLGVA